MNKLVLASILLLAVLLGVLVIFGPSITKSPSSDTVLNKGMEDHFEQAIATPGTTPTSSTVIKSESTSYEPIPTLPPIEVGDEKGEDVADVLLLYDPSALKNFDTNFCRLASYYGLLCQRLALDTNDLSDFVLRDSQGDYFKLIGISASALHHDFLNNDEVAILDKAINEGGSNLFVSKLNDQQGITITSQLTKNAITGVEIPIDTRREWLVTTIAPEITLEFTGQVISPTRTFPQADYAISIGDQDQVTPLIIATDDNGDAYPIFVRWQQGTGEVFIDAGMADENINDIGLAELYFDRKAFTQVIPLMFAMRYTLGHEVWHNDHNYANLTIDDPPLKSNSTGGKQYMDYPMLLEEMEQHDFHTTIAFVPKNWEGSEPAIVRLFLENKDRYSLVQHGNNHDGFEFYKYAISDEDEWPARPLMAQERDILEGLARMWMHYYETGLPFDQIMIFPYGNAPAPTLKVLKERNYLAAVGGQAVPLDVPNPNSWDFLMFPGNFEYEGFPTVQRKWIQTWDPNLNRYDPLIPVYQLFLDRPALLFSHHGELFGIGIDGFSPIADQINSLYGKVEWRNLGDIIRHLYLEKQNEDGSMDISMFSNNHLIVTNESDQTRNYHISKKEILNVPISLLTVNGHEFPYTIQDGNLDLEAILPANKTMEIVIEYGQ